MDFAAALALCGALVPAQQTLVVPSSANAADANHAFFIAGVAEPRHQLTIVDGGLLLPMQNHTITGLAFRRDAANEAFAGGDASLTVRISHSTRTAENASPMFAANHGPDVATAFQGSVTLPASPASGPPTWTTENVVSIQFQVPFAYSTGPIAIEISGTPSATNPATWWPADAVWQPNTGGSSVHGSGSGSFGGPTGRWSFVADANIGPGSTVSFEAIGAPGEIAIWAIASGVAVPPLDLEPFGGVPGTRFHLQPPLDSQFLLFGPPINSARPSHGSMVRVTANIPTHPSFLGASLASQWLKLDGNSNLAASNANVWTIAAQPPGLGMALVTAADVGGVPVTGKVIQACGHVFRFEFQ
ncbi:MAG: hypothetical protein AB7O97_04105 [Planctomycetota bacterium]